MQNILGQLATEITIRPEQVQAAVSLLDGGATVPFIARYRKEVTGGLDDIQLRELEYRLGYLRELEDRRATILKSISDQGKLSPELQVAIDQAATKQDLEDLYLPFKPKRRTKGMIAKEAGIEPLADALWAEPSLNPHDEAQTYLKPADAIEGADFSTVGAVLDGVRDILSERWAEDASLIQSLREWLWKEGMFTSHLASGKDESQAEVAKFRDYFDYSEALCRVPSHRALAVFRGRALEFLDAKLSLPEPEALSSSTAPITATAAAQAASALAEGRIALHLNWSHSDRPSDDLIRKTVLWTWRVKLSLSLERDLFARLREDAEKVAIKVFADNLRDLLLAAPAGPRVVLGLDPGIRTGVKVAVVDETGKLVETSTVYPHEPRRDWDGSLHTLNKLCQKHGVNLIAIGNGTASRETDKVVHWRETHGAFKNRQDLLKVTGLGAKTFEQSAGFLRIRGGDNPLDMTGVHPETYPVVEAIMAKVAQPVENVMGRADMLKTLRPELFANEKFGVITVKDILIELEKPGRDPRPDFKVARFNEGVDDIRDLKEGMILEGTVSNVAAFGAFIDLGVHQDGLVHVSQLSHKFITDAREVVKTGDIVKVKVTEVDVARKRIGLTMKLGEAAPSSSQRGRENKFEGGPRQSHHHQASQGHKESGNLGQSAMASAFAKLQNKR